MRVTEDLGFSSLVLLVVCIVVPVIGFVIRRKWQFAVARNEEIKKLLVLAAEEAARAESEASSYVYATVSVPKNNQCAVCYSPTTTRCARCKAVRYCSGKCQIVHWRQGHKLECCPPSTTRQTDDVVSDIGKKVAEQDYNGVYGEKSEVEGTPYKTSSEKSPISDISFMPKDHSIRVESLAEGKVTDSNSELSSNSFSGFSASTSATESSDDASVCESVVSNEHEKSEGHIFVDPSIDIPDTNSNSVGVTSSSSPKFASLVDSIDGFSTVSKLNRIRPGYSEECKVASNGTSGLSVWKGATIEASTVSPGFWDKTLFSRGMKDDVTSEPLSSRSSEITGNKKSDSGSSFRFSFSTMPPLPPLHAQGTEAKDYVSDDTFPNSVQNNMRGSGSASLENDDMDYSRVKESNIVSYGATSDSDQLESREDNTGPAGKDLGCADSLSIDNLQSSGSVVSNRFVDSHVSTLKSAENRCITHDCANSQLASRNLHSSTKCGSNGIESSVATLSQVARCSANSKSGLKTSVFKVVDQFRGSNVSKDSKRIPLAVGSDIAGRYSDKGLFPYELFVKLYNWNKVELRPFGLINCGNSCYANAVLQCLAFTPPLTAYLLQGLHSKACASKKWCFTCEFESLILKSKDTKSPLSPMGIISQLHSIGSQLSNGREEDAHEFLRHAIDTMQSVCLMGAGVTTSYSLEEETTLLGLTFGGYLRSKIKCMKCGGKSERLERMMDLTVEIEGEIGTLEEALQRFTSTEALDGENKYHCDRCKSYEKAKKKMTVSEAPNVLTIALKRFQAGKFGKLNKAIRFPEILDLAPFMSGTSDKSPIYRLYGVVVHLDILNAAFSGHYVSYVKNFQNKWFKVDDSVVTNVELECVLTKGAYMLFYARCSPRAPRLIRNSIVSPDLKCKVNGKPITVKSRHKYTNFGAADYITSSISPDGSPTLESFYSKFHHLKRILEDDSSSDNLSLFGSNSDEGSCSTDSTRDSTSNDDFSDYIFGDSGPGWTSMWRNSDSDTCSSSSSSPLNCRQFPLADIDRSDSVSPDVRTPTGSKGVGDFILRSDTTLLHRNFDSSRSSISSFREKDSFQRLGSNRFGDENSGVSCRKSRERTD